MAYVAIEAQLRPLIPDFLTRVRSDIVQCRVAVLAARRSTLRQLCHKNRGCCAMFGFSQLSQLFAALEEAAQFAAKPRLSSGATPAGQAAFPTRHSSSAAWIAPARTALAALERYAEGLEIRYH